jgi:hypothetical protein
MKGAYKSLIAAVLLLSVQSPLRAQDTVAVGVVAPLPPGEELPQRVADELVAFYNRASTIRFSGRTRIPAGQRITGDVAVLSGPVELAGILDGDLVVLNGDITLEEGSRIIGDLIVVGGIVLGADQGEVDGIVTTYTAVFRYRRTEEGIEYLGSQPPEGAVPTGASIALPSWSQGSSEIFISAYAYNRIEALPIAIGPRITTGGRNPLRFDAFLIYRTQAGFNPDESHLGYKVRARQWLFGHKEVWLEGGIQNVIDPLERWKLTNLENSLTLFLARKDWRDYYSRIGWYALLGWRTDGGLFGSLLYLDEKQETRETNNVWTIFFNKDQELRPNAAIDQGKLQTLLLTLGIDTRNARKMPSSGWFNTLTIEQAVGGELSGQKPDYTRLWLDLRRWLRVSRNSAVALRLVGGGRLGSSELPAQREHAIGGAGSLPGYKMFQFDCGAHGQPTFGEIPGYGCQRFTVFQAEYRTDLSFNWHLDQDDPSQFKGDIFSIEFDPAFILLFDAGAAWDTDENYWDHLTRSENWVTDIGAGLSLGGLGFYLAYPLVGSGGLNFIVRLTARY